MIWLTWRQFRVQVVVVGAVLVLLAVLVVLTGSHLVDLYNSCRVAHTCNSSGFTRTDNTLQIGLQAVLLVAPALIGIFWGAPLIAHELETGTYRLGWTQSVSRRRWLAVKLGVVGLAALAVAGLVSLLVSWWFSPLDALTANRFSSLAFGLRGITPIGYAAFAFALGVTVGVLLRRTVPAMATTIVGYVVVRIVLGTWVRPHLLPPAHADVAVTGRSIGIGFGPDGTASIVTNNATIPNAWVYSNTLADKAGHPPSINFLKTYCPNIALSGPGVPSHAGHGEKTVSVGPQAQGAFRACVNTVAAHFHDVVAYQPASRYWVFQGLETALFIVLAVLLAAGCFWWVRHRLS